ncbi:signal transduction histidine kinase [Sphaerotilus hippei]|uniref:histidine kinase n=1 Tax=Sphaerotilus hippei TaxID=744406 RepID=A0A318GWG0_9BURK|nr:ATP-binding protein [Sphaerotilus hippei]PXW93894.1 signal transduction histidine kinase [Sphaerotilus hippei]
MKLPDWLARGRQRARERWPHHGRRSIGVKLVVLFLVLGAAMSTIFLGGMQRAFSGGWQGVVRPLVADYVDRLAAEIGQPPDIGRARALAERLPLSIHIRGPRVDWDSSPPSRPMPPAFDAASDRPWPPRSGGRGQPEGMGRLVDHPPGPPPHWLTRFTADGHVLRFELDTEGWVRRPRRIGWLTLAVLLGLTGLAYLIVRHLFRPLEDIRRGAQRYGRGEFDQPIPVRRHDELGEVATQVNTMAADLAGMLEAKRALLLAISHELRSPLTRARLNVELVPEGSARDALLRDLGQMRDLISDLLESERLAQPHAVLQREPTDVVALVHQVIDQHVEPAAAATLVLDLPDDLPPLALDRTRLALLLRNLIDNALRHGGGAAAVPVRVALALQAGTAGAPATLVLTVRDHGPGVDPGQLQRLAEPFHRPDHARQRSTGGVGLGLYLCRLVARAHGGTLQLRLAEPGLEARVELPVVTAAS